MKHRTRFRAIGAVWIAACVAACAASETLVSSPTVSLTSVELASAGFSRQTFHLGFDVDNPNPFPLPVTAVEYRVILDDEQFAGGETEGGFTVPAGGQDAFMISVDLDMLNSATQVASLLRRGMPEQVSYELREA